MCTCIGAGTFYVFDSRFIGKNVYIDTCAAVTARARVCTTNERTTVAVRFIDLFCWRGCPGFHGARDSAAVVFAPFV